jgi:hypothetical protein
VIPSSINFGNARLGVCDDSLLGEPRDSSVWMKNTGADTIRIHSAMPQSNEFSVLSLDSVIPPSDSESMTLQFCPAGTSLASATLLINSNAPQDSSLTVTLTGNGVPYSPGLGSIYNYIAFDLDTAGKTIGSSFAVTDSMIQTGITYQGESNVSETSDTTYFIAETNGDVELYAKGFPTYPDSNYFGGGWQTLPFSSQTPNYYSYNETYVNDSDGETITLVIHDTAAFVGTTNVTIGGAEYPASHVHLLEYGVYTDTKGTRVSATTVEIYFSSKLGTIVQQSRVVKDVATAASGKPRVATGGGREINLVSFKAN